YAVAATLAPPLARFVEPACKGLHKSAMKPESLQIKKYPQLSHLRCRAQLARARNLGVFRVRLRHVAESRFAYRSPHRRHENYYFKVSYFKASYFKENSTSRFCSAHINLPTTSGILRPS